MTARMAAAFALALLIAAPASAQSADDADRRRVAPVVHIDAGPLIEVDGSMRASEASLGSLGRNVRKLLTRRIAAVPFAVAMSGVLCDELRLIDTPVARRVVADIRAVARRRPVLKTTYSDVRVASLSAADVETQLSDGAAAVEPCMGASPTDPYLPQGVSLPEVEELDSIHAAGVRSALSAFAVPDAPKRPTIVPAVRPGRDMAGLVTARPQAPVLVAVLDVSSAGQQLDSMRREEGLETVPLRRAAGLDVIEGVIDATEDPDGSHQEDLRRAREDVRLFGSFTLPDNRLARVYRIALAHAQAEAGAEPDGRASPARARVLSAEIAKQFRKISVDKGAVTFTSRRGSVPVTISSEADYPVKLLVAVSSPKLTFPDGAARKVTLNAPGDTVTFLATARSTGTFPVRVDVTSPRREMVLDSGELSVRSTAASLPAVILTAGGALFLLVFFGRRVRRRA